MKAATSLSEGSTCFDAVRSMLGRRQEPKASWLHTREQHAGLGCTSVQACLVPVAGKAALEQLPDARHDKKRGGEGVDLARHIRKRQRAVVQAQGPWSRMTPGKGPDNRPLASALDHSPW